MMKTHWTYTNCDESIRRRIDKYWQGNRQDELQARMAAASPEAAELRMAVARDGEPDEELWDVQAVVQFPDRTVAAEVQAQHVESALDQIASGVALRLDQAKDDAAGHPVEYTGLEAVVPALEKFHRHGRSDAFFLFLTPICRSLAGHARRELEIQQLEGSLSPGEVSVDDLLDETLLRAWERFAKRPKNLPLNLWLIQLLDGALEEANRDAGFRSLSEPQRSPDADPPETRRDEWIDDVEEPASIELGELLAGAPGLDELDRTDVAVKQTSLTELLRDLPRTQRRTLMFHVADGYEPALIADLQSRSTEEVERDIREARRQLAHRLAAEERIDDVLDLEQPRRPDRRKGDT